MVEVDATGGDQAGLKIHASRRRPARTDRRAYPRSGPPAGHGCRRRSRSGSIQRLRDALARRPDKVPRSFAAIVDTLTDFSPREVLHAPVKRLLTLFSFFPNHIVNHGDSQEYAGAQPVFAAGFDFGPLTADEKEYANIMLFEDYDDAVRVAVCLLDDWRKEGLF